MKQTLYLESTIVSYLTATPSDNLVVAAHQQGHAGLVGEAGGL